jgi:nucleotide-binding universal stress UspA family protein
MVRCILVPLDGSTLAERALPYATALAGASGARLVLVRVAAPGAGPDGVREARAYLAQVAAGLTSEGRQVETAAPAGDVVDEICAEARRQNADLLVSATHGRGGLGRWVYGSVAAALLARSQLPVLLVRAWGATPSAARLADHPRLLVPLDGSAFGEEALPVAESLADALGGELVLLRAVVRPDAPFAPDWIVEPLLRQELDAATVEAESYLRRLAERYAQAGRTVHIDVRVGQPGLEAEADVIDKAGREHGAALAVMTTHGYTGLRRIVLGSVADSVVRRSTLPVVLVRPRAVRAGGGR